LAVVLVCLYPHWSEAQEKSPPAAAIEEPEELEAIPTITVPPPAGMSKALSAANHSMVFRRDAIIIRPQETFVVYDINNPTANNQAPPPKLQNIKVDVDIRGEEVIRQDSANTFNRIGPTNGLMVVLNQVVDMPLIPISYRKPLDILFVNENGIILQIAPRLVMANLQQEMFVGKPIRAFLFLPPGSCEAMGIRPGYWIDHLTFAKKPLVIR